MKNKKVSSENCFETIKNIGYAIKTISKASPMAIPMMTLTQTAYWFFANFVQQILFLRVLLGLIERKSTYKEYMIMVGMFVIAGVIAKAIEMFSDYYITLCSRKIYHRLNKQIFRQAELILNVMKILNFMINIHVLRKLSQIKGTPTSVIFLHALFRV